MTFDDDASMNEAQREFERALLDAARADGLPEQATERAWQNFVGTAGALVASGAASAPEPARAALRMARRAAAKGALCGTLAGSALTALWMSGLPRSPAPAPLAPTLSVVAPVTSRAAEGTSVAAPRAPAAEPAAAPPITAEGALAPPKRSEISAAHAASSSSPVPARQSTLAAEVEALDAVRTALTIGAFEHALALLGNYQREFPNGLLARDSEVFAIEALSGSGQRTEVARRAARFLARYPKDPHATRVRSLLQGEPR